jgi:hypothetical protein
MSTGLPTCPSCIGGEALFAQQGRAVKGLAWGALGGSVGSGVLSVTCCGPIVGLALGVAALISGIRAVTLLNRPDYVQRPDRGMLLGVAITGIVISSLVGLYAVLALTVLAAAVGGAAFHR